MRFPDVYYFPLQSIDNSVLVIKDFSNILLYGLFITFGQIRRNQQLLHLQVLVLQFLLNHFKLFFKYKIEKSSFLEYV